MRLEDYNARLLGVLGSIGVELDENTGSLLKLPPMHRVMGLPGGPYIATIRRREVLDVVIDQGFSPIQIEGPGIKRTFLERLSDRCGEDVYVIDGTDLLGTDELTPRPDYAAIRSWALVGD